MEQDPRPTPEEEEDLTPLTEEQDSEDPAFYFDEEERINTDEEFLKDPTDFNDPVNEAKKRRNIRILAIIAGSITAVVLVVAVLYMNLTSQKEDVPTPTPTAPTATKPSAPDTTDPGVVTNPLLEGFPDAPKVTPGEALVTLKDNGLTAGKNTLTFPEGIKVVAPSTPCKVTEPTDFCLAARGTKGELTFDLYYLKDAAHSRLFENPSTFKKLTLTNSPVAGILPLQLGASKLPTAVIVAKDSSGWMIVAQSNDPAEVEALAQAVKVN